MQYLSTDAAMEFARSMDVQSGGSLYAVFEGFRHRGIAIDASLRSAIDGFHSPLKNAVIAKLVSEADNHREIIAAFTKECIDLENSTNPSVLYDRKFILWQDINDNRDNLYSAAHATQQLLSNLGYNRYDSGIMSRTYSETAQQKIAFASFLKSKLSAALSGKVASASVEMGSSHTERQDASQSRQTTYTENPKDHTGGWEFAMPYFRELGETMGLMPPASLVSVSSAKAVQKATKNGTINKIYQNLRGTEVILAQAVNAAIPDFLKTDHTLRYELDNGYLDAALASLLEYEPKVNKDSRTLYQQQGDVELSWAIHAVLYAALYRGARQRIEDAILENTAQLIHDIRPLNKKSLVVQMNRDYGGFIPDKGYTLHMNKSVNPTVPESYASQLQIIEKHVSHFKLPVHILDDGDKLVITGFPDVCPDGFNPKHPNVASDHSDYPSLKTDHVFTPNDAVVLELQKNTDAMCSQYRSDIHESLKKNMDAVMGNTDTGTPRKNIVRVKM